MLVANSNPIAWDRDLVRRNATVADRVFVVFRGRTCKEQPTWLTVPYFLWSRLQRELGLRLQAAPMLAVIATPSCDADRLPWSEGDYWGLADDAPNIEAPGFGYSPRMSDGTPGAAWAILRSFSVQKMLGPELCFYRGAEIEGRGC
jgi:hypothetical protein